MNTPKEVDILVHFLLSSRIMSMPHLSRVLYVAPLLTVYAITYASDDVTSFRGDFPLILPIVVPDTTRPGTLFGQVALRLSDGAPYESGGKERWSTTPLAPSLQIQLATTSWLHLAAGASWGGSTSAWSRLVLAKRSTRVRWEFETSGGATEGHHVIHETQMPKRPIVTLFDDGSEPIKYDGEGRGWRGWGQFAARAHWREGGPWFELRAIPLFLVGNGDSESQETETFSWPLLSASIGWTHGIGEGLQATGALRAATVDGGWPDGQILLGLVAMY